MNLDDRKKLQMLSVVADRAHVGSHVGRHRGRGPDRGATIGRGVRRT